VNRLAVFDCDGTLVDGQGVICRAMVDCFVRAGRVPPPDEDTRRIVGRSLYEAMAALVPGEEDAVHADLAERYKAAFLELTVMIGDTSYDIKMARAAGVAAIGVAWGYHGTQELWEAGAHHVAARPAEVLAWMRKTA